MIESMKWNLVCDRHPDCYEEVIICYRVTEKDGPSEWMTGAGRWAETCWIVQSEEDGSDELKPFQVCAWMPMPPVPRIAMMRKVVDYDDTTYGRR